MSRTGFATAAALLILSAACDRDPSARSELHITGDSVVAISNQMFGDEVIGAECASTFIAEVQGPDSAFITLRGGRIEYTWADSDQAITSYEWNAESLNQLWSDPIVRAGTPEPSQRHGFGQSVPPRDVRATVVFRYSRGDTPEELETTPYSFTCRAQ